MRREWHFGQKDWQGLPSSERRDGNGRWTQVSIDLPATYERRRIIRLIAASCWWHIPALCDPRDSYGWYGIVSLESTSDMVSANMRTHDSDGSSTGELIDRVHAIMKKLRTLKLRRCLREKTNLSPAIRNKTCWSSTASMIFRYVEFEVLRATPYHSDEALKRMALNDLQELAKDLEMSTK